MRLLRLRTSTAGTTAGSRGAHRDPHGGGIERSYTAVVPTNLPPASPFVLVLHGSGQDASDIRAHSGFGFDRLVVERGFVVVYPNAYEGLWNDCRSAAANPARDAGVDDAALMKAALVERFQDSAGVDPDRVLAAGYSNGGQMGCYAWPRRHS